MKPTKIEVSYSEKRTVNYQSVEARMAVEYEVESPEEANEAYKLAKASCIAGVRNTLAKRLSALAKE